MNVFDKFYYQNTIDDLPDGNIEQVAWVICQRLSRGLDVHPQLFITAHAADAKKIYRIVSTHCPDKNVGLLPDWETLPYEHMSPSPILTAQRLKFLSDCIDNKYNVMIVSAQTAISLLPPIGYIHQSQWSIKKGDVIPRQELVKKLLDSGFDQVEHVECYGQFAVRGGMVDLYLSHSKQPIRLDYFDDTIDDIYHFDQDTQQCVERIDSFDTTHLAEVEWPCDKKKFKQQFNLVNGVMPGTHDTKMISGIVPVAGYQYGLCYYHDKLATIFDFINDSVKINLIGHIVDEIKSYHSLLQTRFHKPSPTAAPPDNVAISAERFDELIERYDCRKQSSKKIFVKQDLSFDDTIAQYPNDKMILYCPTMARSEMCLRRLSNHYSCQIHNKQPQIQHLKSQVNIVCAEPVGMFRIPSIHLVICCYTSPEKKTRSQSRSAQIQSLDVNKLLPGQLVVHESYGLGRYLGMDKLDKNNISHELLKIEYANDCIINIEVSQIDRLTIYQGVNKQLDQPGHKKWRNRLTKAKENIEKLASEMAVAQKNRQSAIALSCQSSQDYLQFCQQFLFEPTDSQKECFSDVEKDMQQQKPMDRLICGDVGFGKTEIAMRAACLAALNGGQVLILAPTTILAQQHFESFVERFIHLPLTIEVLSRRTNAKKHKAILSDLNDGKIDILIATHAGANRDIKIKSLALLIIDEEHKFGVKVKAFWLNQYPHTHRLTLSATPIPRTLNQALSKMHDINLMAMPPAGRQRINTEVSDFNNDILRDAILREVNRGGQIYCVVRHITSIRSYQDIIKSLFPDLRIAIAHGQMNTHQLESVMFNFQQMQYDLLLCTTIIESGIDIANANTIIIMQADHFGMAQLHQLRGRVGRSYHKAYAHMFVSDRSKSTESALARLDAIMRHDQLGAGASLAMEDLEIRGAGQILGKHQSGHVDAIGMALYAKLVSDAVDKENGDIVCVEIDLGIEHHICSSLIRDKHSRLRIYQRIYQAGSMSELDDIEVDCIQEYGPLPVVTKNLFAHERLKRLMQASGISKIQKKETSAIVKIPSSSRIDQALLFKMISDNRQSISLASASSIQIEIDGNIMAKLTNLLESICLNHSLI